MRRIWVSLVAAGLLAIAAIAPAAAQDSITLDLEEVDDSGVAGNVRIVSEDGQAEVTILLTQGLEDESEHPVHIHEGTCDDLGDVAYPLNDIVDGSSETTLDVDLADLRTGDFAVNAHMSADQMDVYIACADIPASVGGEMDEDEEDDAAEDDATDEDEAADEGEDGAEEDEGTDDAEDDATTDEGDDEATDDEEQDDAAEEDDQEMTEEDEAAEDEDDADEAEEDEAEDVTEDEDEEMDEAEDEEEVEAVAPATGSTGGIDSDSAAMMLLLVSAGGLGAGVLLRRWALKPQRG